METVETRTAAATDDPDEESQFAIALRRIQAQDCPTDPQSAVAPFNSAF